MTMFDEKPIKKYMFLNIDLAYHLTGIERASLLRAKIFHEQLGITPVIVTTKYNEQLLDIRKHLIHNGILHEQVPVLNMYEYFQETIQSGQVGVDERSRVRRKDWTYKDVPHTNDTRVYRDGRLMMYQKRSPVTGRLHYINYFHQGKKIRRDKFDGHGCLSVIQTLDPDKQHVLMETYYRVDGTPCIIKHYTRDNNKHRLGCIMMLNRQGDVVEVFNEESELISYWLRQIITPSDIYYFMIDKNRVYYKPLQVLTSDHVHIITLIHSLHVKNGRDMFTGAINSNYADIFADVTKPDAIVLLTEKQKMDIQKRFGIQGSYHVIPHALEKLPAPVPFIRREEKKVAALSRYSPEKNLDHMIEMFSKVVQRVPEASLEIYGSGSEKRKLLELIDQLGMKEHIFLKPYVANPSTVYESAVFTLLTSKCEAFSLVTMESLSHGCPVIGYDIKYGPSDMIMDGKNGFLIPVGDQEMFVQRMIDVLTNRSLNELLSQQAYEYARQFKSQESAKRWRHLLENISKRNVENTVATFAVES